MFEKWKLRLLIYKSKLELKLTIQLLRMYRNETAVIIKSIIHPEFDWENTIYVEEKILNNTELILDRRYKALQNIRSYMKP